MPKQPQLRTEIYKYILAFFKKRHEISLASRIRRTRTDDRKYPTIESIVNFVLENPMYFDSNSTENIQPGQTRVSKGTIRKAVKQLIEDNRIDIINGSFEFVPHMEKSLEYHPILEISDKIDVTIGVPEEILVLSVDPQYTTSIANYLSAMFYKGDIIFIPISGKILCISVFPESILQNPNKLKSFSDSESRLRLRIEMALHSFNRHYPKFPYKRIYDFDYQLYHNPEISKTFSKAFKDDEDKRSNPNYISPISMFYKLADYLHENNEDDDMYSDDIDPESGLEISDEELYESLDEDTRNYLTDPNRKIYDDFPFEDDFPYYDEEGTYMGNDDSKN